VSVNYKSGGNDCSVNSVAVAARLVPQTAIGDVEMLAAFEFPTADSPAVIRRATSLAIEANQHLFDTLYHAVLRADKPFEIGERTSRYFDARHARSRVRRADFPATRATR